MAANDEKNASRGRGSPTSTNANALDDDTPWHLADLEGLVGETYLNDEAPPSKPRSYRHRSTSRTKREKQHRGEPQRPRSLSKGAMERATRAAASSDEDDYNTNHQRRKPSSERRGRSPGALPRQQKSSLVKKIAKELEKNSRGGFWKSSSGGLEAMTKSLTKRGRSPGALNKKDHRLEPSVEKKKENKKPAAMEHRNVNHSGGGPGKSKTRKHECSSSRETDKRPSSFSLPRRTASDSRFSSFPDPLSPRPKSPPKASSSRDLSTTPGEKPPRSPGAHRRHVLSSKITSSIRRLPITRNGPKT